MPLGNPTSIPKSSTRVKVPTAISLTDKFPACCKSSASCLALRRCLGVDSCCTRIISTVSARLRASTFSSTPWAKLHTLPAVITAASSTVSPPTASERPTPGSVGATARRSDHWLATTAIGTKNWLSNCLGPNGLLPVSCNSSNQSEHSIPTPTPKRNANRTAIPEPEGLSSPEGSALVGNISQSITSWQDTTPSECTQQSLACYYGLTHGYFGAAKPQ